MVAGARAMNSAGISCDTASVKARSLAAWPDGNDDVTGPVRFSPAPGGRDLVTSGLIMMLPTIAVAP